MSDRRLAKVVGLFVAAIVMAVAAGCGVNASSVPQDAGDGLGANAQSGSDVLPPWPNQFSKPVDLVLGFLKASAGAGERAVSQVTRFFNDNGKKSWTAPEAENDLTVIRVTGTRTEASQGGRNPVVVDYQVVGILTERGRLTKLLDPAARTNQMKFWIVPQRDAVTELRIDDIEGEPKGLLISDEGLTEYYSIQPIYFWDEAYASLVPDLRYIVKGLPREARANFVVQWLIEGPSPMLGAVQRLRSGTKTTEAVTDDKGVLSIKFNPLAAADDRAITRLLYQLQWSLRASDSSAPAISLQIGDVLRKAETSDTAYQRFNEAHWLPPAPQAFDIVDEKVVALPSRTSGEQPTVSLLTAKENRNVVAAAINRNLDRAALVVRRNGRLAVQILRKDEASQPAPTLESTTLGQPVWVPGSQLVLVPSAGRIRWVNAVSGKVGEITRRNIGDVTALAVSPDGRRIAFVAAGRLYVAQLGVDSGGVTVEPEPQLLLINASMAVVGVAWASPEWLNLVGTVGSTAVIYEVTADGVVARRRDLAPGIEPSGIVAYPTQGSATSADVYVLTPSGAYIQGNSESGLSSPFFAN